MTGKKVVLDDKDRRCSEHARQVQRLVDRALLEETTRLAAALDGAEIAAVLDRAGRATVLLAGNVSPELVLDDLVLAWPRPSRAAA